MKTMREGLRDLAKKILERSGYSVLMAQNGWEAIEICRHNPDGITAVLLDLTMPVMGGDEAFRHIRKLNPEMPIIISSGYGAMVVNQQFALGAMPTFLQKPYSAAKLTRSISSAIQRSRRL